MEWIGGRRSTRRMRGSTFAHQIVGKNKSLDEHVKHTIDSGFARDGRSGDSVSVLKCIKRGKFFENLKLFDVV